MKKKTSKLTYGTSSETNGYNLSNDAHVEIYTSWGKEHHKSCVYIVDIDSETTADEIIEMIDVIVDQSKHEIVFIQITPVHFKFSFDAIGLFENSNIYVR